MRGRTAAIGMVLVAAWSAAMPQAQAATSTTRAPYTRGTVISSTRLSRTCQTRPMPVTARTPNESTGRIDISQGRSATACAEASGSLVADWVIPAGAMAGRSGDVIFRVRIDDTRVVQSGTAARRAQVWLASSGRRWNLASVSCAGASCSTARVRSRVLVFRTHVTSLPRWVVFQIGASASIENGTGAVGAEVRGRLISAQISA